MSAAAMFILYEESVVGKICVNVGEALVPAPDMTFSSVAEGTTVAAGEPPVNPDVAEYFTLHKCAEFAPVVACR